MFENGSQKEFHMKKLFLVLVLVFALAVLTVNVALGAVTFTATLSGASEVPGPGDPDGSGFASITVNSTAREICYFIHVSSITLPATAAHIHIGSVSVPGPIVVPLIPPDATGTSFGCVSGVDQRLIRAIRNNTSHYYVNVHTSDFGPGAVRGQLS
jgi:hypothetical protein